MGPRKEKAEKAGVDGRLRYLPMEDEVKPYHGYLCLCR